MEEDKYRLTPVLKEKRLLRTHAIPLVGGALGPVFSYSTYQEYKRAWLDTHYKEPGFPQLWSQRDWEDRKRQLNTEQRVRENRDEKRRKELGLPPKRKPVEQRSPPVRAVPEWVEPVEDEEVVEEQPRSVFSGSKETYKKFKGSKGSK